MEKGKTFLVSGILSGVILAIAGLSIWYVNYIPSSGIIPNALLGQVHQPIGSIVEQIRKDQPSQINAVIDGIWRLAALRPGEMGDRLPAWLGPLLRNKRYADVEALSLAAILQKAWNPASVAIFQEARVRALLGEGLYPQALAEAKMYYNVAPLSRTPTAIDLLERAWAQTHGSRKIGESDIPAMLSSIKVDSSRLEPAISGTNQGSPYPFANLTARGDLLLLADRPAEAEQSFLDSCKYVVEDWDLHKALEGMAQAMRDQDGSLARAIALVNAWQAGNSAAMGIALPSNIRRGRLRDAALGVVTDGAAVRGGFPRASGDLLDSANLPPADSSEPSFSVPVNDATVLARLTPQSDPELRDWMDRWQSGFRRGQAVDQRRADELVGIVTRSKLPNETLLSICGAYDAISKDDSTSAAWLVACAGRIDPKLADWLTQGAPLVPGQVVPEGQYGELAQILGHARASCEMLYQFGNSLDEVTGDHRASAVVFVAAVARGHEELAQFGNFCDGMRPILQAMKGCEALFWRTGSAPYLGSIDVINTDLDRWVPAGDSQLGWTRAWAKIGHAECLYFKGKNDEAIAAYEKIDPRQLGDEQRTGLAYSYAMALNRAGRHREAIPQLRTATGSGSEDAFVAWAALSKTLACVGDKHGSRTAFQEWSRRFHPSAVDTRSISQYLEKNGVY